MVAFFVIVALALGVAEKKREEGGGGGGNIKAAHTRRRKFSTEIPAANRRKNMCNIY
jgi:hypothetical protein